MSTPTNNNSNLDPQNPMHRLAHQTAEELPEQPQFIEEPADKYREMRNESWANNNVSDAYGD